MNMNRTYYLSGSDFNRTRILVGVDRETFFRILGRTSILARTPR